MPSEKITTYDDQGNSNVSTYDTGPRQGRKSLKKQINALLASRPQYQINEEAFENQDLARANAFGRDRAIQGMEQDIEQGAADTLGQAQGISSSSSALLSALGSINEQKNSALRGLGQDEAQLQRGKMQDLYGANMATIEEKDKAFDYNVNQPYQNKIEELRMRRKARQENAWRALDTVMGLGTMAFGGFGGGPKPTA